MLWLSSAGSTIQLYVVFLPLGATIYPALLRSEPRLAADFHSLASLDTESLSENGFEHKLDVASWRFDLEKISKGGTLPPNCQREAPKAKYWTEKFLVDDHVDCSKGMCGKRMSNQKRLNILRNLTHAAKAMLSTAQIADWFLDAGTAIGAMRCEDILPWDVDCDIMIPEAGIKRLAERFFHTSDWISALGRKTDIDENYEIRVPRKKDAPRCIPFMLVDKHSGYVCDLSLLQTDGANMQSEWPFAKTHVKNHGCSSKGWKWPVHVVLPAKECRLNDEVFPCPHDVQRYLELQYDGADVFKPNRSTTEWQAPGLPGLEGLPDLPDLSWVR